MYSSTFSAHLVFNTLPLVLDASPCYQLQPKSTSQRFATDEHASQDMSSKASKYLHQSRLKCTRKVPRSGNVDIELHVQVCTCGRRFSCWSLWFLFASTGITPPYGWRRPERHPPGRLVPTVVRRGPGSWQRSVRGGEGGQGKTSRATN